MLASACRHELQNLCAQVLSGVSRDPVLHAETQLHPASAAVARIATSLNVVNGQSYPEDLPVSDLAWMAMCQCGTCGTSGSMPLDLVTAVAACRHPTCPHITVNESCVALHYVLRCPSLVPWCMFAAYRAGPMDPSGLSQKHLNQQPQEVEMTDRSSEGTYYLPPAHGEHPPSTALVAQPRTPDQTCTLHRTPRLAPSQLPALPHPPPCPPAPTLRRRHLPLP